MNRRAKLALLMIGTTAATLVFCAVVLGIRYRASPVDAMLILFTYSGDTKWSPQYAESKFRDVKIGDKMGEVRAVLGSPNDTLFYPDGSQLWSFSRSGRLGKPYFLRVIRFDADRLVIAKEAYYRRDGLRPREAEAAAAEKERLAAE